MSMDNQLIEWADAEGCFPRIRQPMALQAGARGRRSVQLSTRESEVLQCLAAGDSNKMIARTFDLSLHTVKRHVANILGKLDVRSRGQAAAWLRSQAT